MDTSPARIIAQKAQMLRLIIFAVLFASLVWVSVLATEIMSLRLEHFWLA